MLSKTYRSFWEFLAPFGNWILYKDSALGARGGAKQKRSARGRKPGRKPGRPAGSGHKPGRPAGSGKPGRPPGSGKRGPGRPKNDVSIVRPIHGNGNGKVKKNDTAPAFEGKPQKAAASE